MDYKTLMGILNRRADGAKKPESPRNRQLEAIAILGDRQTVDVFHYEIRQSVFGGRAVEQLCDVGVAEVGEDLSLGSKSADQVYGIHSPTYQLHRYRAVVLSVCASCEIDDADAASSQLAFDAVRADHPLARAVLSRQELSGFAQRVLDEVSRGPVRVKE